MKENKPRILIVSSIDPTKGPGVLASDYYKAYREQGYEVDLLTLYKSERFSEFLYVYERPLTGLKKRLEKIHSNPFGYIKDVIWNRIRSKANLDGAKFFKYREEENPPVPVNRVLKPIRNGYDFVHILFWQDMLSFATVLALYRKLKCKFFFDCVDYSPMAGGCHFMGDCKRYKVGCGCCPAFESSDPHDFTWHNVNYRKMVYAEVNPVVSGNSYMSYFYDQSVLLRKTQRIKFNPIIDLQIFHSMDKSELMAKYSISEKKQFKILFGCQSIDDERKGIKYLIEAINTFMARLTNSERSGVLVMAIGKNFEVVKQQLNKVDTHDFGFVSMDQLPSIYSLADVFLCSSVNDAGPMMVNQSLCCGTPVVGFEMGACLDAVKDEGTGYCAKLKDTDDFAAGIEYIYRLSPEDKQIMSEKCLEHARNTYSYEAAVKRVLSAYYESPQNVVGSNLFVKSEYYNRV